jgi:pimeloyl-ACP methyl ester carboxylesterase
LLGHHGGSGPPLVCLHGFADSWRTWELVLPALERRHEVFAPALPGHAGGPPIVGEPDERVLLEMVERTLDEVSVETAHLAGNSLGGYVALKLAERGRARSVVAFAPAGGWAPDDDSYRELLRLQATLHRLAKLSAPHAASILATPEGRRRATQLTVTNYEHIPVELIAHQMLAVAACEAALPLIESAHRHTWTLDPERIACPVRVVWGTADRLLPWPAAAHRFREEWLADAEWVELEGVGHSPQLDVPLEAAELILGLTSQSP